MSDHGPQRPGKPDFGKPDYGKPAQGDPSDPLEFGLGKGKTDSQLRLIRADDQITFPEDAEPTDDSPTIISKTKPNEGIQASAPSLSGTLRGRKLAHFELIEP